MEIKISISDGVAIDVQYAQSGARSHDPQAGRTAKGGEALGQQRCDFVGMHRDERTR